MNIHSTGNATVDAIGKLNITGNIIPETWYKTVVKKKTGKPNLRAIMFLADIIYWYRPTEIRDEITGQIVGYKKKMHADMLQRSYLDCSNKFGCSKGEATTTIDELVELGVVIKDLRTVEHKGMRIGNVLYLGLNVDRLIELTYPIETDKVNNFTDLEENKTAVPKKADRVVVKKVTASTKKADTYTKSTQETTTEIIPSFIQETEGMTEEELSELVENEIYENDGIPYSYNLDKRKMTLAIHHITDWNLYHQNGYVDKLEQKLYNIAVDGLIEMVCESEIKTYNKRRVTYANVIDKINESISGEQFKNIRCFIEQAMQDYIRKSSKDEVEYPKNYMKPIVLDSFDTYDVKFGAFFSRTYNGHDFGTKQMEGVKWNEQFGRCITKS